MILTGKLYRYLAGRAASVIILGALFCTLIVKFFHAWRLGVIEDYVSWIYADVAVLLVINLLLCWLCLTYPKKWVIRMVTFAAALVCTWSVMNASWIIRTGTQILPQVLLPLVRAPINSLCIVGLNLWKMPVAAVSLLLPSLIALIMFFYFQSKPVELVYTKKQFLKKLCVYTVIIVACTFLHNVNIYRGSVDLTTLSMRFNSQLRIVTSIFKSSDRQNRADIKNAQTVLPIAGSIKLKVKKGCQIKRPNIIVIVLEGVQYDFTSLANKKENLTPFLAELAEQNLFFDNARCCVTHTTKALFGLLTGRWPSATQDLAETVPTKQKYLSLVTILSGQLGYRTAFFQSAKGDFESRPSMVCNLGFDKFFAREDLGDPNHYIGYLGCDEYEISKSAIEWMGKDRDEPFLFVMMCSVTHDPYLVPKWFQEPLDDQIDSYKQTLQYTDQFLRDFYEKTAEICQDRELVFCVVGDHGEAFGEHGLMGHERIAYDEALKIVWVMRAEGLIDMARTQQKIEFPVSSVDVTPTILSMIGLDVTDADFSGNDVLRKADEKHYDKKRKVFFSGWMLQGPAGFVKANKKYVYYPGTELLSIYNIEQDPDEHNMMQIDPNESVVVAGEILEWRKKTIFKINGIKNGKKILFENWQCSWRNRVSSTKYKLAENKNNLE